MNYSFGNPDSQLALLEAVVENSDDAIITEDLDGIITTWNRGAGSVFGYAADESIGRSVSMLVPLDRIDEDSEILSKIRNGETVSHYETARQRKDGSLVDISLTVSPLRDSSGKIFGASKIARDISYRRRAHTGLERLAAIVESSDDAIISKDLNGIITSWNHGAELMFGYSAEEAVGQSIMMIIPSERADEEPAIIERIRNGEKIDHFETVRCKKNGMRLDISLTVSPILDESGRVIGASKIARDISERVRTEAILRQKEIMERILQAQESERNRIARDLHDQLGQKVTGMRLLVGTLMERSAGYDRENSEFQHLKDLTAQIDRDISFLAWELRPTEIEVVGLPDAINSFVREWSNQYGVPADFHFYGPGSTLGSLLPHDHETHIYRIAQEALNNILKHAGASSVDVVLTSRGKELTLTVEDNGKGFDVAGAVTRKNEGHHGVGLMGMTERAKLMNGTMIVDSRPGRGTTLVLTVPIDRDRSNGNAAGRTV